MNTDVPHDWNIWRPWEGPRAVFDACVLANINTADLLLRLAEVAQLIFPVVSEQILEETERTLRKFGWTEESVLGFRSELIRAFPNSMISGHEKWISRCENHAGDRHVLAAAIESHSSDIITFNLRHFREAELSSWGIKAIHPQDYLISLLSQDTVVVMAQVRFMAAKRQVTPLTMVAKLGEHLPEFSKAVLSELAK